MFGLSRSLLQFFFLDAQVMSNPNGNRSLDLDDTVEAQRKKKDLYGTLLKDFAHMRKRVKKIDLDAYAVVNVGPSVVPNPYLPSFRIFSYNISGPAYLPGELGRKETQQEAILNASNHQGNVSVEAVSSRCSDEAFQNTWRCKSVKAWNSSPNSPSRRNTLWSPLGYAQVSRNVGHNLSRGLRAHLHVPSFLIFCHTQYYLPNLTGTAKHSPKYKLEYLTFAPSALHPAEAETEAKAWRPVPLRHLPKSLRNSTVVKSKYAPYKMADLTIPSWLTLAQRLSRPKHEKLRTRFKKYMYMGSSKEQ